MGIPYGVASMVDPLTHVLVKRPDAIFAAAFDDPTHGYRHPVDLDVAQREHDRFVSLLTRLGVTVHHLDGTHGPDLVYVYDPALVTAEGAILLRSGKPTRRGEEDVMATWMARHGIPIRARMTAPATADGGDVFWLAPDRVCAGRSLRTNEAGLAFLRDTLDAEVLVFDVPYDDGPQACLHLLSVISPVARDLALVELRRLPAGLYALLRDRGVTLIPVDEDEVDTLACNVLAVRPGVVVMVDGNPKTRRRLEAHGVEVHTFAGREICWNGSGGPTCLTRPIRREPIHAGG